jgi:adenosylcobinamide kinase/adenosylcobinamide-phosphate guanylyltransferase
VRIRRDPVTVIGDETHEVHWLGTSRAGKVWGVGRSESQETCPDAGKPWTGLRGRTRVTTSHQSELILGGVRSGKSQRALALAKQWREPTVFLATAPALDDTMTVRVARHQAERPTGWTTVEESFDIVPACRRLAGGHDLVIIDCLTLWVSNRMHRGDPDEAVLAGADELATLMSERMLSLIVVSNEVGAGIHPSTEVGLRFCDLLGSVNQRVAAAADRVTLMVAGLPVPIKATPPAAGRRERVPEAP